MSADKSTNSAKKTVTNGCVKSNSFDGRDKHAEKKEAKDNTKHVDIHANGKISNYDDNNLTPGVCVEGIKKSSPGVAEYISPPRSKVPTPLDIEVNTTEKYKHGEEKKQPKQECVKLTEPVKVVELASMSSKELDEHLSGLRNTVKRLQEVECSFVAAGQAEDVREGL